MAKHTSRTRAKRTHSCPLTYTNHEGTALCEHSLIVSARGEQKHEKYRQMMHSSIRKVEEHLLICVCLAALKVKS